MPLAVVIVVGVVNKALVSSPAGGVGVLSEASGLSKPDVPSSAARSPEAMSCWEGHKGREGNKRWECVQQVCLKVVSSW